MKLARFQILKPETAEQRQFVDHVRQSEQVRQLVEDAILALAPMPVADAGTAAKTRVLLLLRQAVLAQNKVITRQHMAASEGSAMAEKVFSQGTAIEGLDEEAAKAYKEAKKEKEKEAKAAAAALLAAQQAQAAQSRGGGVFRGGYRGRYNYHPYQQYQASPVQAYSQQYVPAQGMAMMPAQGQQPQGYVQQHGQDSFLVQQQPRYFMNQRGSMQLQQPRGVAMCYGCGQMGHYNKDNVCQPGAREAYMQLQAGGQGIAIAGGGQQLALQGPGAAGGN